MIGNEPRLVEAYRDERDRDELSAALLVARLIEPAVDATRVRRMLDDLCKRCISATPAASPEALIEFLRIEDFKGADEMMTLDASRIDLVLERRRGIPITLSVPYLVVGRALGLAMEGINFPSRFLVRAAGTLIDPLHAQALTAIDIDRWLADANLSARGANALVVASADDVALRMMNNIKSIHAARGDFVAVLALIDCQLLLATDAAPLLMERADLWLRLGDAAAAYAVLDEIAPQLRGTRWEAELDKRLSRLRGHPRATLH